MAKGLHRITPEDVSVIVDFIRYSVKDSGAKGVVIGMSGGLDSAVVTKLCADALGPEKVLNIFMPTSVTSPADYILTKELSAKWGTEYKIVDIEPAVDTFTGILFTNVETPLERGNISARCRMIVLYNRAKKMDYLVAGTSNRSEYMMGYFTKFGDGASDILPIVDLYKTQVWELAELIGIPKEVIDKVPTAGLWEGQTDEEEMGITYKKLDQVLDCITRSVPDGDIADQAGIPLSKVAELGSRVAKMEHKRAPALHPDISFNR